MRQKRFVTRRLGVMPVVMFAMLFASALVLAQQFSGPGSSKKVDHVDAYHGTKVADPYRWLEDDSAPTAAWVAAQNKITFGYLEKIPFRAPLKARLEKLFDYPKYSAPCRRATTSSSRATTVFRIRAVLYVQKGLEGKPDVLIDPNEWSKDGTSRLTTFSLSREGRTGGVWRVEGGSDWQEYRVLESPEEAAGGWLEWVKVSGAA